MFDPNITPNESSGAGTAQSQLHNNNISENSESKTMAETSTMTTAVTAATAATAATATTATITTTTITTKTTTTTTSPIKANLAAPTTAQETGSISEAPKQHQSGSNNLTPMVKQQQTMATNSQDDNSTSSIPATATTSTPAISSNSSSTFHHNNNNNNNNIVSTSHSQKGKFNSPSANSHQHQSNSNHSSNSLGHNSRSNNPQRSHINSNHNEPKHSHHSNHYHHHHHGNHNNTTGYHHHHNHGQQHHQSFGVVNAASSDEHQHSRHHLGHHLQNQQQNSPIASFNQAAAAASSTLVTPDVGNNNPLTNFGPPHCVDLHVNAGECISLQSLDGQEQVFTGPATITMISQQQSPPVPIPVQVPPGHMVHQIADENGTLKHIILSVMVNDESSQLNSTVINLPHGSFRINSLGELVSVEADLVGDRDSPTQLQDQASSIAQSTSNTNTATAPTLHHLPQQQTYFANYDGCPVVNYDTTLEAYSTHYSSQPAYNNMVAGSYHHESTSPSSYKTSPSLLPPHPAPIIPLAPAATPYPFAYSNFSQIQSHQPTTMASVISSAVNKQSSNHHKNASAYNGHQPTTGPYKVTDNENHLIRNNRSDLQPAAQNNMGANNVTSIIPNSRVQRNDINSKRQQHTAASSEESNKYTQRTQATNHVNHSNNAINGGSGHNYQNNFRSPNSGPNVGSAANSRLSRIRGNHQHHHQGSSAPSYGLRNHYNTYHGDATHDSTNLDHDTNLLSSERGIKGDSKHVNNFTSSHSPNLILTHQKNQQGNQRSTDLGKTSGSGSLSGDLSPVLDSTAIGKKRENRTSATKENQNSKQKLETEVDTSEIAKWRENGSPIPSRSSRGKYKNKILKESVKQSIHKRQPSVDDSSQLSTDYLQPRSVNEDASKSSTIDNNIKTKSQDKKNLIQQESSSSSEGISGCTQAQSNNATINTELNKQSTETKRINSGASNVDNEVVATNKFSDTSVVTVRIEASTMATTDGDSGHPVRESNKDSIQTSEDNSAVAHDEVDGLNISSKSKSKQTDSPNKSIAILESSQSDKGNSPARKKSKWSQGSPKLTILKNDTLSVKNEDLGKKHQDTIEQLCPISKKSEDILTVSESIDQPEDTQLNSAGNLRSDIILSMHTSRSENDIQFLDCNSLNTIKPIQIPSPKQHQPPPPIHSLPTQLTASDNIDVDHLTLTGNANEQVASRKSESKRKSSNGKSEQQFKLNSLPQVRLLNLKCVSVTSSTVCLRWTYIPSLAEKHGIHHHHHHHHHHHGSKHHGALYDHFVVESSSFKNSETNTLINPKIVYQGCAMTCRINQLVAEKVYHFRIRRTALVSGGDGEHLAVSEILSVTLPSAQQANSSKKSQNSNGKSSNSTSDNQLSTASGDSASMNLTLAGSQSLINRCNTSSHNNSNLQQQQQQHHNTKSSSSHHHNHPIKLSNFVKQCRNKFVTVCGTMVRNSLSSCSDTNFAGFLLILFTIVAMLLAIIIHLYIVAPVYE